MQAPEEWFLRRNEPTTRGGRGHVKSPEPGLDAAIPDSVLIHATHAGRTKRRQRISARRVTGRGDSKNRGAKQATEPAMGVLQIRVACSDRERRDSG